MTPNIYVAIVSHAQESNYWLSQRTCDGQMAWPGRFFFGTTFNFVFRRKRLCTCAVGIIMVTCEVNNPLHAEKQSENRRRPGAGSSCLGA